MTVHLIQSYVVALAGLAVGAAVGLIAAAALKRMATWDAWVTVPLLLGAAGAHIALIPQVEMQREVLFGLYAASLIGTVIVGIGKVGIWRAGAVIFPAGSIAAYFYFAIPTHQADYVGLVVKVFELAAICSAIVGAFTRERAYGGRRVPA